MLVPVSGDLTNLPRRSLPLTLAAAQLRHRRSQNLITVLGVAVGVMVLITALSLTNGFVRALVDATLRAVPQLSLNAWQPGQRDPALERALAADPAVAAFAPFSGDKGLLVRPASRGRSAGTDFVEIVGVTPRHADVLNLRPEEKELLRTLKPGEIVLGSFLAQSVGAFSGDTLRYLDSRQQRSGFKVKGLFRTGNYLIDSRYAFVRTETLRTAGAAGNLLGYQVRLTDPDLAPEVGRRLAAGRNYSPVPWQDLNRELLDQLALQKRVIGFVVFLIVIVASFGIANVLTLTVFEKTPDIAILRAIGARRRDVLSAFVIAGVLLGVAGLLLGNLLGLALSLYFKVRPFQLPGDLYFISALPVELRATDFLWVNVVSLVTTILASLLPARRAANVEPARIIR
ncbi:ABC transporter permease [Deinococcus pimensis]|uniref:ABC transporter permease n=1 Tax=Deinococcus pimensis TaxID=309888 RepID=UPI0004B1B554|nr:ABC transporter permease [Deinococcus pimensis]